MKVLIIVSCALALAAAGYAPAPYHGPQHIPVIHNGVPVETPEVQHAKHAHLSALAEASAKAGPYVEPAHEEHYNNYDDGHGSNQGHGYSVQHVQQYAAPVQHVQHYSAPVHHAAPVHYASGHHVAPAYETSHVHPQIGHDGKPLDTPEVEAAKSHHFQAHHEALSRVASQKQYHGVQSHYRKRRGLYASHYEHVPVIGHNGVPIEPLEVQHARAEHLAAHALASSGHSYGHGGYGDGGYGGLSSGGHYSSDLGHGSSGYSIHQNHAPVYGHHDSYSHYTPQISHDGKPLDTPEVEYAKAKHFQAYHEAAARNSHYGGGHAYGHQGPIDTPEVQHAKAVHFAAHAAAKGYHY